MLCISFLKREHYITSSSNVTILGKINGTFFTRRWHLQTFSRLEERKILSLLHLFCETVIMVSKIIKLKIQICETSVDSTF